MRAVAGALLVSTLALVAVAVAGVTTTSAKPPATVRLQAALDALVGAGAPGAIVLVRDGDHVVRLHSGFGTLRPRTQIRGTDRFRAGSVTKTFVATVVLQLVDEHRLGLDDSVEQWLPGLVPNGRSITVRQLLNMTSGLFDYPNDGDQTVIRPFMAGDLTHQWTPPQLVAITTAHRPRFAPGTDWSYSIPVTSCWA